MNIYGFCGNLCSYLRKSARTFFKLFVLNLLKNFQE